MSALKQLLLLLTSKHEHFLFVDYEFYKKWNLIVKLLVRFNRHYKSCLIFRKKYKIHKDIVIVGLKWSGKNVKRRTTGFAKDFLDETKNARCIYCNCNLTPTNATTDHIVPISKGGNNTQVNFIVSCLKCNSERGDMDFYKYLKIKNKKFANIKRIFI